MSEDRIEREITIAAPPENVWAALTEADHLEKWFGSGQAATVDLRPGGSLVFDHGSHGELVARIVTVEQPCRLSYRWSQGAAGEEPDAENSTLVEFTLSRVPGGTHLSVVESGFSGLSLPERVRSTRREQNTAGWDHSLDDLRRLSERLGV